MEQEDDLVMQISGAGHWFLEDGSESMSQDAVEHEIDTGHTSPIRCAPSKMKKEEECVADMLTGGQIETSDSPWWSPVVLVTKKDSGTRFCVDYWHLNDVTVKDAYPLPRIDDTLDMLAGRQWFSTLDLASGYWQVSLSQDARAKTVFGTHSGLFLFRVMPFGLCNAPATFERLMDRVLQGLETQVVWTTIEIYQVSPVSVICTVLGPQCRTPATGV